VSRCGGSKGEEGELAEAATERSPANGSRSPSALSVVPLGLVSLPMEAIGTAAGRDAVLRVGAQLR